MAVEDAAHDIDHAIQTHLNDVPYYKLEMLLQARAQDMREASVACDDQPVLGNSDSDE